MRKALYIGIVHLLPYDMVYQTMVNAGQPVPSESSSLQIIREGGSRQETNIIKTRKAISGLLPLQVQASYKTAYWDGQP
jgi:hypothetical protein